MTRVPSTARESGEANVYCEASMPGLTLIEMLAYCTVRIEVLTTHGTGGVGTGFFFNFLQTDAGFVPAIVTNKHVVANANTGTLVLHEHDGQGNPLPGIFFPLTITSFLAGWVNHPDPNVDLCIYPMTVALHQLRTAGKMPFAPGLNSSNILRGMDLQDLQPLEEVVIVGYPSGIWDHVNNMPVMRRGIAATKPGLDYRGRTEFLIDAPIFWGSSGSPVFLYNAGAYPVRNGGIALGMLNVN